MAGLPKVLNVAEKNDAAKGLANIMSRGRFQRREGYSKFNKIYEFDYSILGRNCKMVMTSVSGHLLSLDFVPIYRNWKNYPPVKLFEGDIQKTVGEGFVPIKRTLEREIRGCQDLILWTDGDREGEDIAAEIVDVCKKVRTRIRVHRARFSEITPQSISRACNTLGVLDQGMVDAVEARQELDLRIGCAFTRFQTMRLCKVFPQVLSDQLISYGPCQFPTLGFVVDRYKQIQAFIPETFYKIKVSHQIEDSRVEFNWKRVRLFNHTCCLVLYQICMGNPLARVVNIQNRPRSRWRPLPLDTVEMEKLASRKLRISAKETMRIAEKLYTQGFISYPRTETNIFPPSFDLGAIVNEQTRDANWGGFASQIVADGPNPRQGNKTDNAHPPIHPTRYNNNLQGTERQIYEFVVRHFLACCSKNAEGQETTVEIDIAGEKFTAQGLVIIARNYLDVYPYDKWSAKTIPFYQLHSSFQPSSIEMVDGETTPPPLLQEADLIALMEKHGIGTDATHAEHIETIKTRRYVGVQDDGSFIPGELGIGLVEGYDEIGYELSKPKLRSELESDLKRICQGNRAKQDVINETLQKYKTVFLQAKQQAQKLDHALAKYFGPPQQVTEETMEPSILSEIVRKCPYCSRADLVVKRKRDGGFMLSCLGFPDCKAIQHFPQSIVDAKPDSSFCTNCQPRPVHQLKLKFRPGSVPPYLGTEYVGCTTCDDTLINMVGFRPIKLSTTTSGSGSSQSTRGRGGRGRGGGGGGGGNWRPPGPPPGPSSSLSRGRGSPYTSNSPSWGRGHGTYNRSQGQGSPSAFGSPAMGIGRISRGEGGVVCMCGEEAVLLTVRNEQSANKGRQFYKCPKRDGDGKCSFFLWADQASDGVSNPARVNPGPSSSFSNYSSYDSQDSSSRPGFLHTSRRGTRGGMRGGRGGNNCQCGLPSVQKTVRQGANEGRIFYTCPKPRTEQCGYFEWSDGPSRGRGEGNWRGKGRARTSSFAHGDDGAPTAKRRAPPTCSICRIPGHTKRTCPNT